MIFAAVPFRNLWNHRTRSALTVTGIAVAIGSLIALMSLSRGAESGWTASLRERGIHILGMRKGTVEILSASIPEAVGSRLLAVAGVSEAAGELLDLVELDSGEVVPVSGFAPGSFLWKALQLRSGSLPAASSREGVLLGEAISRALGKNVGDEVGLAGRAFRILGIFRQESVIANRSIAMPLAAMQDLLGRSGGVTLFHLRVADPEDASAIAELKIRLAQAVPEMVFSETSEAAENNHFIRMLRAITWGTSTVALAMAAVAILNTLLMSVMERRREFGVLTAVGWTRSRIIGMVVLEGLLLSFVGAAGGAPLGVIVIRLLTNHPQLGGVLQPDVSMRLVVEAIAAALLLGIVGGLYPAWRATRRSPIDELRGE